MAKNWFTNLLVGDHRRVAEIALANGRVDEALEAYTKGGHYLEGARVAAEHGRGSRVIELYIKAVLGKEADTVGDASAKQAGELLAASGEYRDAIALFEAAQEWKLAADMALKISQPAKAARLYEKAGLWAPAATNYERVNLPSDALRMLDKEVQRLAQEKLQDAAQLERTRVAQLRRAELMIKLGRILEAAQLYRAQGLHAKAAPIYAQAGHDKEAAEAYLAGDMPEQALRYVEKHPSFDPRLAADIYRRNGRHREAANLLVRLGSLREAAEQYEAASDWARAAEQWEKSREPLRAAGAYRRASRLRDAARCFDAAGSPLIAAEAYAEAGDFVAAGEAFARGGAPYQAATQFLRAGRKTEASRALQRVTPSAGEFERATFELVPLLLEEGLFEPALRRLEMLPAESKRQVDRLYWEARVLEAQGRSGDAEFRYQKLLALDREHRDVTLRLTEVQRVLSLTRGVATVGPGTTGYMPSGTGYMPSGGYAPTGLMPSGPPTGGSPFTLPAAPAPTMGLRATPRLDELPIGYRLVERYEILAELGQGGMGKVYKALDHDLEEVVAIKTTLRSGGDRGASEEERLRREVQICRKITHPNVVRVYDFGRVPDGLFVTMEFIDGTTLEAMIEGPEGAPPPVLPLSRIRWLLAETAAGLRAAHALEVVHRDLKPGNLIVTDTRLKILDFGIARMVGADVNRLTSVGFSIGTPMYMSPEQVRGLELDARSDLYSLGIIAYRLLSGTEPFVGEAAATIALAHLQKSPPDLEGSRPGLPAAWHAFVGRLLAKKPAERFQSADEVLDGLGLLPDEASTRPLIPTTPPAGPVVMAATAPLETPPESRLAPSDHATQEAAFATDDRPSAVAATEAVATLNEPTAKAAETPQPPARLPDQGRAPGRQHKKKKRR